MIAWLTGKLLSKQPPLILLDVNGVGYELEAPLSVFYDLPDIGEKATFYVHMVVREDAQLLFAFATEKERNMFRGLIRVNGIGPKVALAILSTLSTAEFLQCIANEDVTQLCRVPGIGKKTAQRLVVEMKDKIDSQFADALEGGESGAATAMDHRQDAIAALVSLGYKQNDASRIVGQLEHGLSSEEIIKQALRSLSGKVL